MTSRKHRRADGTLRPLETHFYRERRPREQHPECVLVTADNLEEVAAWAGGRVEGGVGGHCVAGTGSMMGPIEIRAFPGMMLCKRPGDHFLYARHADEFHAQMVAVDVPLLAPEQ